MYSKSWSNDPFNELQYLNPLGYWFILSFQFISTMIISKRWSIYVDLSLIIKLFFGLRTVPARMPESKTVKRYCINLIMRTPFLLGVLSISQKVSTIDHLPKKNQYFYTIPLAVVSQLLGPFKNVTQYSIANTFLN